MEPEPGFQFLPPLQKHRWGAFFSLVFREAIRNKKARENPARPFRQEKESNARQRFLSADEYDRLLAVIEKDYPEHLCDFLLSTWTGMRLSEQHNLLWKQVDFNRKVIELEKTKNDNPRTVPLNSTALTALQGQYKNYPHALNDLVFPRDSVSVDCRDWFTPAMKKAGVQGYVWHSNRHTFCSWLAMAGVSMKEIQILAGHRAIVTTAKYMHLAPGTVALASERMPVPRTHRWYQQALLQAPGKNSPS